MKAARYRAHRIQRGGLGGDGAGRYWLLESGLQQGGRVRGVVPDAVPIWCCRVLLASDELFLVLWLHSRVVLRWLCQFGQFGLCQRGLARAVLSGCGAARALKLVACSGATPRNAGRPHKPGLRFARLRPHLHASAEPNSPGFGPARRRVLLRLRPFTPAAPENLGATWPKLVAFWPRGRTNRCSSKL